MRSSGWQSATFGTRPSPDARQSQTVDSDIVPGRWRVLCRLRRRSWEIIVEPDAEAQHVVVITAYPLDK